MLRKSVASSCHYLCLKSTFFIFLASLNAFLPTPSEVKNKLENLESCPDQHGQLYVRALPTAKHTTLGPDAIKDILLPSEELGNASTAKSEIKTLHAGLTRFWSRNATCILKMCSHSETLLY